MRRAYHGKMVVASFCEAVGLDPKVVRSIEIRAAIDEAVTVKVEGFARMESQEELTDMFQEFTLRLKDGNMPIGPITKFAAKEGD